MSGFLGRNVKADTGTTRLVGLKVQTTVLGRCIPWVFGTNRVAPNVVQYDDFNAIEKQEQSGGKGGGGSAGTSYDYRASVILALCRGQITGVGTIWVDKKKGTSTSLGMDVYVGTDTQTPHGHWAANHADRALAYRGLAYLAKVDMDLGSSGSVERHNVEVVMPSAVGGGNPDARLDTIITALLTDKVDGIGLSAGKVGDLAPLANFCGANGIFISPAWDEQRPAKELLQRLADIAQCGMFWSDGKLKFAPYSDTAASGNGYTYTPNVGSIPELTIDDFQPDGDNPPIRIKRVGAAGAKNHYQLKYSDRATEYIASTVDSKDLGSIERYGVLTADVEEYAEICVGHVAQKLADFRRDRAAAVRTTYEFRLSLRWDRLEPMDIVALTYAPDGLQQQTVRIVEIEETDEGDLSVTAEDCPLGAQFAGAIVPQPPAGGGVDYNAAPGDARAPVVFEAPGALTQSGLELWIAASGAGANWGGCSVWVSLSGSNYRKIGVIESGSRHGTLSSAAAASGGVNVAMLNGTLGSGSAADAAALQTLCFVRSAAGEEFLAYSTATLTGVGAYSLGGTIVRGAYGSQALAHPSGAALVRCDNALARSEPLDHALIGKTISIKLTSFNVYGGAEQTLDSVTAYSYTVTGARIAENQAYIATAAADAARTGGGNLVKDGFLDGSATTWDVPTIAVSPAGSVAWTHALSLTGRDAYEGLSGAGIDVTPGETLHVACDATTIQTPVQLAFGVRAQKSDGTTTWVTGATKPGGQGWSRLTGSLVIPAGYVRAWPWLQLNTAAGTTQPATWVSNLWIGRAQLGATVGAPAGTLVGGTLAQDVESNASTAKSTAISAQSAATAAQTSANTALGQLQEIGSDGKLAAVEKKGVIVDWQDLWNGQSSIVAQANAYSIVTERDAYTTALTALANYLTSLSPGWSDTTQSTTIVPAVWRSTWDAAYQARTALLNKIAAVAGTRADYYSVANRPAETPNLCWNGRAQTGTSYGWSAGVTLQDWGVSGNYWQIQSFSQSRYALLFQQRDSFFGDPFPVVPGEVYSVTAAGAHTGGVAGGYATSVGIVFYSAASAVVAYSPGITLPSTVAGAKLTGQITVPAGATAGLIWVQVDGYNNFMAAGNGAYWIDIDVRRAATTALIAPYAATEVYRTYVAGPVYHSSGA